MRPIKPKPLLPGDTIRVISPASPAKLGTIRRGERELGRLGYRVRRTTSRSTPQGYFSGSPTQRLAELEGALRDPHADAIICARGGYGTAELLGRLPRACIKPPRMLVGFSDITALHAFLWQRWRLTSFYGPMVAAGFESGADRPGGYDQASFTAAVSGDQSSWLIGLGGEPLVRGEAKGVVLGGCVALLQTLLGTPWDLETRGAILLLEDRGVKPYELDRMLLHLGQAGKLKGIRGIILGDFPESSPPQGSSVTVRDVCRRLLVPLGVPVVFGAAVGHTKRAMLTLPLGVRARLDARGEGKLEILEPAVATQG